MAQQVSQVSKEMNLNDIFRMDQLSLINWFQQFGVIPTAPTCPNCGNSLRLTKHESSIDAYRWYCGATTRNVHKRRIQCSYMRRLRYGTFFSRSKLDLKTIAAFTNLWIDNCPLQIMEKQTRVAHQTAVDWSNFCREIVYDAIVIRSQPIGGIGEDCKPKVVEIDESKFGRRKYNKGHHVDGQWVFGGFERGSGRLFMVPVEKRDADTLIPIIKQWILPRTTIVSDFWKAYDRLPEHGYNHLKVNHSLNFVDPISGAHTNSIESSWRHAKVVLPAYRRHKAFFTGYLAKYMFQKHIRSTRLDPTEAFFQAVAQLYKGTAESEPTDFSDGPIESEEAGNEDIDASDDDDDDIVLIPPGIDS